MLDQQQENDLCSVVPLRGADMQVNCVFGELIDSGAKLVRSSKHEIQQLRLSEDCHFIASLVSKRR